jgi:hypothetical protein
LALGHLRVLFQVLEELVAEFVGEFH